MFLELTLVGGEPLDIPVDSVLLLEELDETTKATQSGAQSGLFFDLGLGLQTALVQQTFDFINQALPKGSFTRLTTANSKPLMLLNGSIIALRGIADSEIPGNTQITVRLNQQSLNLNLLETRDEIREKMNG